MTKEQHSDLEQFKTTTASYDLTRLPIIANDNLRAWDAADELLINYVDEIIAVEGASEAKDIQPVLIVNDTFGALTVGLNEYKPDNWSDSIIAHLAANINLNQNGMNNHESIHFIPSTQPLDKIYKWVLIKIPKTLSLLEDQLYRLKPHINKDTIIIGAAMTKHIHNSTLELFSKIIGPTKTSLAKKKARLIFAQNTLDIEHQSAYPKKISDEQTQLTLINYANVFSKDKLDVGSRFLIQHIEQCPKAQHIIDIGCGNGALGIMAKRNQPNAKISFVDESYNAVASAKDSYINAYPESLDDASFQVSNILEQFEANTDFGKTQLVLCNPPFHQVHSIGDHIAWEMFKQSREALVTDGEIWVVGNRHLGYHIKLKKVFGNCRTIASNPKFVILAAKKLDKLNRSRK